MFPFAAVLGQEKIKNALLWNVVNPKIGGALISGEKGTAKSTLARGVAALTETMGLVELPLNITEDRLVGSIDLKAALVHGQRRLEPGLLRAAHGNILYVDEVNLLSDHIVNALLEVAASGVNVVEREGISCRHDARFILVGSMNQEEGKLRPQLLDRFGLYVEVEGEKDPGLRMEIMSRRLDYERNPLSFLARFEEETARLRRTLEAATVFLPKVEVTANALQLAATLAVEAHCAGHRAELVLVETARAIAAMDGRVMLNLEDIRTASAYALPHRARELAPPQTPPPKPQDPEEPPDPPEQPPEPEDAPKPPQESPDEKAQEEETSPPGEDDQTPAASPPPEDGGDQDGEEDDVQAAGDVFALPQWQEAVTRQLKGRGSGRRNRVLSGNRQGRYVSYRLAGNERVTDLAFDATVRAAAPFQAGREKNGRSIAITGGDLRVKIREKRTGGWILFVVDASASMGANQRMREVKAAILSMLGVSYQKRDRVALITFRKEHAELLLGFTRSVELAQKQLAQLPTGGRTPLAKGLELAYEQLMGLRMRDPEARPTLVLVSDGRASGPKRSGSNPFDEALKAAERIGNQGINTVILDTENDFIRFGLCQKLQEKLNGVLVTMETLRSEGIVQLVDAMKGRS